MTPTQAPNLIRIFEALRAYQETGALRAAIQLDVFTAISEGAKTAAAIAAKCSASERGVRILCDTLTVSGLLTKHGGVYENTVDTGLFLTRQSPAYMGTIADFLCDDDTTARVLREFRDCVTKGGTTMSEAGMASDNNPAWVTFARAMAPITRPSAHFIAEQIPSSGAIEVLDIAAGHGMYGITIARKNPQARITALDWDAVLQVAQENAAAAGLAGRYRALPGSAFEIDFGGEYDVVLLTNILHHFGRAKIGSLLAKVYAALKPGGRAITLEFVPNEDRVSPPVPARFAMTMLANTAEGDAYTFSELDSMFRSAGFASNVQHPLETEQSVIISTK